MYESEHMAQENIRVIKPSQRRDKIEHLQQRHKSAEGIRQRTLTDIFNLMLEMQAEIDGLKAALRYQGEYES